MRGPLDSPAPRHHQLHFHFVGNDDAQDLTVGTFPQPAGKTGKLVRVVPWQVGSGSMWRAMEGTPVLPSPEPLDPRELCPVDQNL